MMRISTRNARFQQWAALLDNRTKRQRAGEFLVQGVRPITLAVERGWVRCLLYAPGRRSSRAVRASTGSLFAVPVVRADAPRTVVDWARERGARIVGTDESGVVEVGAYDLRGPVLIVIGNETQGMSNA